MAKEPWFAHVCAAVIDIQEAPIRRGVLIVDDDPDLRVTLGELLGSSGIRPVFEASSLADMLNLLPDVLRCNLALIDVNLGQSEPSGLDVHAWLVEHHFRGHVVFMTGHARTHSLVQKACAIDGVSVLRKPIDPRVLEGLALQNGGP